MLDNGKIDRDIFQPSVAAAVPAYEPAAPHQGRRHGGRHDYGQRHEEQYHSGFLRHAEARAERRAARRAMALHHARHGYTPDDAPAPHRGRHHYHALRQPVADEAAEPVPAPREPHGHGLILDVSKLYNHYQHAPQTQHACLRGFYEAGQAAGIHLDLGLLPVHRDHNGRFTHFARDAGPMLEAAGMHSVGRIPLSQVKAGDAIIWGAAPQSDAGHSNWVVASHRDGPKEFWSDNHQTYTNPYGQNNYQVYRAPQVAFGNDLVPDRHYAAGEGAHAHPHGHGHAHGNRVAQERGHRHVAEGPHAPSPFA